MGDGKTEIHDIAIVGASLVGLTLARALASTLPELRLAIVAPSEGLEPPPGADPRAYAIAAASRRLLTTLGVWRLLAHDAQAVTGIDITDSGLGDAIRPVLLHYDTEITPGDAQMHIVPDQALRRALLDATRGCPGITWVDATAGGFTPGPHGAVITCRGGAAVSARLVVAADGARSTLREAAEIGSVGWSYEQMGIAATIVHTLPHGGRAVQHFLPGGPFALLPLTGNRSCITWSEPTEHARRILAAEAASFLAEARRRIGHRLGDLSLAGPPRGWPLALHLARGLVAPRLALAGDAARLVHPIAGQGLNLGLRDVGALAEALVDGLRIGLDPGDATILERYARWRRFDGTMSAVAFDALNRLFSREERILRSAREVGLGIVDRLVGLKQAFVAEAAGTSGDLPRLLAGRPL